MKEPTEKGGIRMYYPYPVPARQDFSRLMTVNGSASLSVKPDTVSIQLEVVTESDSLMEAQQENTLIMNQVIEALLQAGIPREDIQTAAYSINPLYDYIDGKQVFRTFQVRNAITVTIRDIDQVGQVIETAVENGVNRISNIQFMLDDQEGYYRQALSLALQNAIGNASALAGTMNVAIDPTPVKVTEQQREPPVTYQTFVAAAPGETTPIEPGQITVNAEVKAQFKY
ncbi:SIMPL domain-containing protein [Salipaludibacillus aurantiacus]|nr:SIMPL domain-containing protein [Salipaludibacillus aurantiacus]